MPTDRVEAWLRMRDTARFVRDAAEAAVAVRRIGDSAGSASRQHQLLAKTSERAHTIIRGVGTAALYAVGGLGLLAGSAAAVGTVLGIKFNANMETLEVAFANFLGSTGKARSYLNDLYQIAASTPFEFPELAGAARRFLAFGFAADDTKKILMTVGDTIAGIGGGAEEIQRLTLTLGQIQAKGRLQSEELLQLAELGIPAYRILKKELGLTGDQLQKKLRKGAIDAKTGIDALTKGLDDAFGGASQKQARTFNGQLSTMKDNALSILGTLTKPGFDFLKKQVLPRGNQLLAKATTWARGGGGPRAVRAVTAGFEKGAGPQTAGFGGMDAVLVKVGAAAKSVLPFLKQGFKIVKDAVMDFWEALKPGQPFLQNVIIPLLKGLAIGVIGGLVSAWKILIFVLKMFMTALGFVGKVLAPFKGVFQAIGLVIGFVFGAPILKAIGAVSKLAKILSWPIRVVDGLIGGFGLLAVALFKFRAVFRVIGTVASFVAKHVGSLWGLIGKGLGLWSKLGWLIGPFILKKLSGLIPAVGLLKLAFSSLGFVIRMISRVISAIIRAVTLLQDKIQGLLEKIPDLPGVGGGGGITGALGLDKFKFWAGGGVISAGDVGIVGEAGPELARGVPGGVRVTPLHRGSAGASLAGVIQLRTEVPVVIAGREIARATADQTADWNARKGR